MTRFWPDERQALLLHAALLDGDDAAAAWRRWRADDDALDGVDGLSFDLLPLLYRNLTRWGVEDPDLPRLKGVYRYAWYANQRLLEAAGRALRALGDRGLETLVLGGVPLAELHYRDAGVRPIGAVDIAVRPADAGAAVAALREAGWALATPLPLDRVLRSFPSTGLIDGGVRVAVHWSVLYEPGRDEELWRASGPLQAGGVSTRALAAADQLLHTCAGAFGVPGARLRWIADGATVVRAAGGELDWGRLVEQAVSRRLTLPVSAALGLLRERFGVGVPDDVLAALRAVRATPRERFVHRVRGFAPAHGAPLVRLWDRYRRLRSTVHDCPVPGDFPEMLAAHWRLSRRRELVPQLARRSLAIAARRPSHA